MSSISRKTAVWGSGAVLAVAGCAGAVVIASASGGQAADVHVADGSAAPAAAPGALRVLAVNPHQGARQVSGAARITVTYNEPLPASAPRPTLSPKVSGSWRLAGNTAVFTPAAGYPQDTKVTVRAAAKRGGKPASVSFTTGSYRVLRLQQILAQLGYLPLTWTPAKGTPAVARTAGGELAAAYSPPAGKFAWKKGYPSQLRSFWSIAHSNTIDRGAVTAFEADHHLKIDGTASAAVWRALLTAAAKNQRNTHGYSYAVASQVDPESLTIWHNGKKVFSSPANTGISVAPTAPGTYPVYEKLPYQVMTGTNPDGSHYADPVSWVSYFNGGDAVHYFDRGSYGYPQSLGCVELPYTAAKEAYPYLPYGTLVTVTPA